MTQPSVYERVTDAIVRELAQGVAPWVRPWSRGGTPLLPYNATTQRRYSGVNILLLWGEALDKGYRNPAWITYHQAVELGGHVKKGEHGSHVVYASTFNKKVRDPASGEETDAKVPFLRFYAVFNVEQTAGLPTHLYEVGVPKPLPDAIEEVESFLAQVGARVRHGGDQACYRPVSDVIDLPDPSRFESAGHYYATSLHEHAHWTGHPDRLARDLSGRFGSEAYAGEELVAELAGAFLCASLSVPGRLRHAEYLGSWLKLLEGDKRAIFTASARATEAARFLEKKGGRIRDEDAEHAEHVETA
jgi:antirestriction protein ArdC